MMAIIVSNSSEEWKIHGTIPIKLFCLLLLNLGFGIKCANKMMNKFYPCILASQERKCGACFVISWHTFCHSGIRVASSRCLCIQHKFTSELLTLDYLCLVVLILLQWKKPVVVNVKQMLKDKGLFVFLTQLVQFHQIFPSFYKHSIKHC